MTKTTVEWICHFHCLFNCELSLINLNLKHQFCTKVSFSLLLILLEATSTGHWGVLPLSSIHRNTLRADVRWSADHDDDPHDGVITNYTGKCVSRHRWCGTRGPPPLVSPDVWLMRPHLRLRRAIHWADKYTNHSPVHSSHHTYFFTYFWDILIYFWDFLTLPFIQKSQDIFCQFLA